MGTHPIFESDFDCLTEMKLFYNCLSPPARAVKLTLLLAKVEHETETIDLMTGEQNKPDFVALNPAHCVPTIQDEGFVLWESRAILNYIGNKNPASKLVPECLMARAKVDYILNWDLGTFYKAVTEVAGPKLGFMEGNVDTEKTDKALSDTLDFFECHIATDKFLVGDNITVADISVACSLSLAELIEYDFSKYKKVTAWMNMIKSTDEWKQIDEEYANVAAEWRKKCAAE